MLTQNITVNVSNGTAPYEFQFLVDDQCATFEENVITSSSQSVTNEITYQDAACRDSVTMSVTIIDAKGCTQTIPITAIDSCINFNLNPINQTADYSFDVSASSPGCSEVQFTWSVNSRLFDAVSRQDSNFTSSLVLGIDENAGRLPSSSSITVTATDCNNCSATETITFPICTPVADNLVMSLNCTNSLPGAAAISPTVQIPEPSTCTTPIDWSTIQFNLPTGISALTTANEDEYVFVAGQTADTGLLGGT